MASLKFVTEAAGLLAQKGFRIENIDSNILAERPETPAALSRNAKEAG